MRLQQLLIRCIISNSLEADKEFNWLVQEYNDHPLPIFLKGLGLWWKIDSYSGISDLKKLTHLKVLDDIFLRLHG